MEELINTEDPFINTLNEWISEASNQVTVLSPSENNAEILVSAQVSTYSILGCLIYHTGGILIDHGWLRILGSGNKSFLRDVYSWNKDSSTRGLYLIADDAAGGFYAINGGAFPDEINTIYYWAPDSIEWEPLGATFSEFFGWLLSGNLEDFYSGIRWEGWNNDIAKISTNQCVSFYPFLWSEQGDCKISSRRVVPIDEALLLKFDLLSQFQESRHGVKSCLLLKRTKQDPAQ